MDDSNDLPFGKKGKKPPAKGQTKKRGPKKVTRSHLENVALYYLERFATSAENLRRVLMRRVIKSAAAHDTDPDEGAAIVDDLIARYQTSGLLDDAVYARSKTGALHRSGNSVRTIRAKLRQKGVDGETIDEAFEALKEETPDPDHIAAMKLAKKRRIGPFRDPDRRAETREKDMARLARAGFSYHTALSVIDAEDTDEVT